jgi:hypothetical protein
MMNSIKHISNEAGNNKAFYLLLGDFLDEFYQSSPTKQADMISESPNEMNSPELVPFLASVAHRLANISMIETPEWVFEPRCYLPGAKPHFACNARDNMRLLFMYKSPPEFKHRNLFVDENVLVRV